MEQQSNQHTEAGSALGPDPSEQQQLQQAQVQRQQQGQSRVENMDDPMTKQPFAQAGPSGSGQVGPNAGGKQALQQLMATLQSPTTPEQQNQILHILKSNPPLMAAFIKQRQLNKNAGTVGSLNPDQPRQQQVQLQQQGQPGMVSIGGPIARQPDAMGGFGGAGPVVPNAAGKQALQQLKETLRSPMTPEQQNQILHILKSNPSLMAAFIKQRQVVAMQQQSNQHNGVGGPLGPNQAEQQQQQQQQQEQSSVENIDDPMDKQPSAQDAPGDAGQVVPNTVQEEALQQLMATIESPTTPEQQFQILHILKSNPPLMAALIKQRQALKSCLTSQENEGHQHDLETFDLVSDDESSPADAEQLNPQPDQNPNPVLDFNLPDGRHYKKKLSELAPSRLMSMVYELYNQDSENFVYHCNKCESLVVTRYHCTVCDDFDLCESCKEEEGHPHVMEKLGSDLDDGSSPADAKQVNAKEAREFSLRRCITTLVHACQCKNVNCRLASCARMKRVITHIKSCQRRTSGGCPICKQLVAVCCQHARLCREARCAVPFCLNIKQKLKQPQIHQRLQQAASLRRRMAVMTNTRPQESSMQSGRMSTSPSVSVEIVVKPGVSPSGGLPPGHHPPDVEMEPGLQMPPANVLQVVKQVQEEAARQQVPHVGYGELNPAVGLEGGVNVAGPSSRSPSPSANLDNGPSPPVPAEEVDPQEAREFSLRRCITTLVHACQCKNVNCRLASCARMKRVITHIKSCRRRTSGGCPICKQLVAVCCHHARLCREARCAVPFCFNVKQKLTNHQFNQRLQQAQFLRRRMAALGILRMQKPGAR